MVLERLKQTVPTEFNPLNASEVLPSYKNQPINYIANHLTSFDKVEGNFDI